MEQYQKRYNAQLVQILTGIQNEKQLKAMMDYCHPEIDFILAASDYEIVFYVLACFDDFLDQEK